MENGFTTPDTVAYLYLGLAITFGILLVYIGSVYTRFRNAQKDIDTLNQLTSED